MDVTIKGIPIETLLEFYEKHKGCDETVKARAKRYREAHKKERNQKAKEYYQKKKNEREKGQATHPEDQATSPD
jgi:hypothetical protein